LADLSFARAAPPSTLQEYRDAIDDTARRLARLTEPVRPRAPTWRWAPLVAALPARRGVSFITAMGVVADLGDLTRVGHPRELMACLGLVPSAYARGPSVRRGGITKAGHPHVRRLLAEAAWAYQGTPRIGRQPLYRQDALPKSVCDIASTAQLRLTGRVRRLVARGKSKPKVATAIARELSGFMWAMAREVETRGRLRPRIGSACVAMHEDEQTSGTFTSVNTGEIWQRSGYLTSDSPYQRRGFESSRGTQVIPCASATALCVTAPSARLTPFASAAFVLAASRQPFSAISRA
jgi:hypothetical protein